MGDLHAEGITDLFSYFAGKTRERDRIIQLLIDYAGDETLISVDVAIALIEGAK